MAERCGFVIVEAVVCAQLDLSNMGAEFEAGRRRVYGIPANRDQRIHAAAFHVVDQFAQRLCMFDRIRFDGHVDEGVTLARGILNRLRFSRDEIEQVVALIENHMKFKDLPHMKDSTLKRFLRMPAFEEHLELHRLDVMSSNRRLESYELAKKKLAEFGEEHLKPEPFLTGADLIGMGYRDRKSVV